MSSCARALILKRSNPGHCAAPSSYPQASTPRSDTEPYGRFICDAQARSERDGRKRGHPLSPYLKSTLTTGTIFRSVSKAQHAADGSTGPQTSASATASSALIQSTTGALCSLHAADNEVGSSRLSGCARTSTGPLNRILFSIRTGHDVIHWLKPISNVSATYGARVFAKWLGWSGMASPPSGRTRGTGVGRADPGRRTPTDARGAGP
jgi:hypothetical protein